MERALVGRVPGELRVPGHSETGSCFHARPYPAPSADDVPESFELDSVGPVQSTTAMSGASSSAVATIATTRVHLPSGRSPGEACQ